MEKSYPFFDCFEEVNGAGCGTRRYVLYPGMEFGSREKWWPDAGRRSTPHEGIDICYYQDGRGNEMALSPDTRVPAMACGRVGALCRDFLGHTVIVDHEDEEDPRFCSIYAHLRPVPGLSVGQRLEAADVIGLLADTSGRRNRMPAHLHLSMARIDSALDLTKLDWTILGNSPRVRLLDPLSLFPPGKLFLARHNQWKAL